ncbi:hypothetical protein PoB_006452600 [Plakobranchus ocellatus]|uniref:Uncharacterized protein n=1 Tax=Plakobranchus ocellatus TaxID=259542 RepID=A0AAV4D1G2_9GAST|nr:hypothetical protein PoB_006452600 [Plakobranchus ocellatus]
MLNTGFRKSLHMTIALYPFRATRLQFQDTEYSTPNQNCESLILTPAVITSRSRSSEHDLDSRHAKSSLPRGVLLHELALTGNEQNESVPGRGKNK